MGRTYDALELEGGAARELIIIIIISRIPIRSTQYAWSLTRDGFVKEENEEQRRRRKLTWLQPNGVARASKNSGFM